MTQLADPPRTEPAPVAIAENITRLVPYRPGKPIEEVERELGISGIIKLASNENALGPSPKAIEAMQRFAAKMHHYPDAASFNLRNALAEHLTVSPETIVTSRAVPGLLILTKCNSPALRWKSCLAMNRKA